MHKQLLPRLKMAESTFTKDQILTSFHEKILV